MKLDLLRQQPRGLYLVSITEFWERFSYWGMLGLLVLFLTAAPATGGFGWDGADALQVYALYTGAVFAAPAIGGYLASRFWGERRCILWGGIAVAAGHVLLAGVSVFPWIVEVFTGHPVLAWLHASTVPLGRLFPEPQTVAALQAGRESGEQAALMLAYDLQAWTFALSLTAIVAGTGLIKSTVSSIVGKLYAPEDRRRDEGYAIFMAFVYLGAVIANFIAGTLGELLGWHYGFAAAGVGMVSGLVWYAARHRKVLGDVGMAPDMPPPAAAAPVASAPATKVERQRIAVALIMSAFVVLYALSFYQKGGLLNLETRLHVDRTVWGFEIPATWLLSVSTMVFILLTLPITRLWRSLAARGKEPDVVAKLALGLLALACGYLVLMGGLGEKAAAADGKFSVLWIVGMYACFAIGDLLVWPTQIAAVSRLAPVRYAAFAVGSWYLTIGFGSWLTGPVGTYGIREGVSSVAVLLISLCVVAALVLLAFRRPLMRLTHGALDAHSSER